MPFQFLQGVLILDKYLNMYPNYYTYLTDFEIFNLKTELHLIEVGRNDPEASGGRHRPCARIGFRRLDFFGYFFCQEKK